jgi:hypothetical protein
MFSTPLIQPRNYSQYVTTNTPIIETTRPQHTTIGINPPLYTQPLQQQQISTITNIPSIKGAISEPIQLQLTNHIYEHLQESNPMTRECFWDAHVHPERYMFRNDIIGEEYPTTHYIADQYIPSKIHWGSRIEDNQLIVKLYNVNLHKRSTWHDNLNCEEPYQWISKFPGKLHDPHEILTFDVLFQLKRDSDDSINLTPNDLIKAFSSDNVGHINLNIPNNIINQIFQTENISLQTHIIPHFINIVEIHSNLPIPVSIQLRTDNNKDTKTEWFRSNTLTSRGLTSKIIHPNTHIVKSLEVFELSQVAREAMFFRWINTDKQQLFNELNKAKRGDFYHLDTPFITNEQDTIYGRLFSYNKEIDGSEDDIINIQSLTKSKYQVSSDALHVNNLASFIALDEWSRLQKMRQHESMPQEDCTIHLEKQLFIIRCSLFDRLVHEKFDGPMESSNHVMRTDKPMQLRVSLLNPSAIGKKELIDILTHLHPNVDFPKNEQLSSCLSRNMNTNQKVIINDPPCYNMSVRIRIRCARLETGIKYIY